MGLRQLTDVIVMPALTNLQTQTNFLCSKIDMTAVHQDFIGTWTMIQSVDNKINFQQLRIPITSTGIGTLPTDITQNITIAHPGSYYLTADLPSSYSIIIAADSVTLDLNGYYVNAIVLNTGHTGCTIQNGFISAISTDGDDSSITNTCLKNCTIYVSLDLCGSHGFLNDFCMKNCITSQNTSCNIGGDIQSDIIVLENCFLGILTINNCYYATLEKVKTNSTIIQACTAISLTQCHSFRFDISDTSSIFLQECCTQDYGIMPCSGFTFRGTIQAFTLKECSACGLGNFQENLGGFDFSQITGGSGLVSACIAQNNSDFGFKTIITSNVKITFIGNIAKSNGDTPATPAGDSNYCTGNAETTTKTTFIADGPGLVPYYQYTQAGATSSLHNLTLP